MTSGTGGTGPTVPEIEDIGIGPELGGANNGGSGFKREWIMLERPDLSSAIDGGQVAALLDCRRFECPSADSGACWRGHLSDEGCNAIDFSIAAGAVEGS